MKRFLATLLLLTLVVAQPSKVAAGIKEGLAAYARGDYITALRELRPLAEQGDAAAQSELGVMYNNGQGVPRDDAKAFKWFSKAAEQGDDDGQYNLGVMYNNGQGVQQSYAEAIKWFRKAAEQGYVHGQYRLGVMYENGLGVTQDYVLAHMWHNLAAAKGYKDALKLRDIVAKSMTAAQIARAQHLAHEWTAEFEKKPAPSKPYEGNAPTAPTAAYAGNSDSDFRAIKLGDNFDPIINGYENNGKIPAAPGVRVDAFLKSYLGGSITNAVGMYRGVAILKMQNALQDNKAKCQHGIVIMVEALQKAGIRGWENYWRKDYDVPVYNVKFRDIYAKVTCRGNRSGWFLEYLQALRGEKLKKLLR